MNDLVMRAYTPDDVPEKGPIPFVAATEGVKRDGKDVVMDGVDLTRYEANPVILWGHNLDMPPIGRAEVAVDGSSLMGEVTFDLQDPFAAAVDSKYRRGYLRAFSAFAVATAPVKRGVFEKSELIEISAVPVGVDPEALTTMQRSAMRHFGRELLDLSDSRAVRRELSANDKRERLYQAVSERFGGEDTWVWVRDFGDDWVVYEVETPDAGCSTYRLGYTAEGDGITLDTGEPEEVEVKTEFVPVNAPGTEGAPAPTEETEGSDDEEAMRSLVARLEGEGFLRSTPNAPAGDLDTLRKISAALNP